MKHLRSNIKISSSIQIYDGNGNIHHIELKSLNKSQSAIYSIKNKFTGQLYIGQTRKIDSRWNRHIRDLVKGEHCSKLQSDWDLFKEQNGNDPGLHPTELFEFSVIIYCLPSQLSLLENTLINTLNPYYNIKKKKEISFDVYSDDGL